MKLKLKLRSSHFLVALEEFEDTLAIEKIVRAGTERFWLELESIMLRLGSGLDIEPDAVELPVSPRTICSAYRQSLENIDFPGPSWLMPIARLCGNYFPNSLPYIAN